MWGVLSGGEQGGGEGMMDTPSSCNKRNSGISDNVHSELYKVWLQANRNPGRIIIHLKQNDDN